MCLTYHSWNLSVCSQEKLMEISTHSWDFFYLNVQVSSMEFTQLLLFTRDGFKTTTTHKKTKKVLMATVILSPKVMSLILSEEFSEHFEILSW